MEIAAAAEQREVQAAHAGDQNSAVRLKRQRVGLGFFRAEAGSDSHSYQPQCLFAA